MRKRKYEAAEASNEFPYFQDAEPNQLKARKVYIDPNKRDLLYCLGINKDGDQEEKLRYTNSQRRVECRFKKYSRIREQITRDGIQDKQLLECSFSKKVLDRERFNQYLQDFFQKFTLNQAFYSQRIFRKLKLNSYINTQKSESKFVKAFTNVALHH